MALRVGVAAQVVLATALLSLCAVAINANMDIHPDPELDVLADGNAVGYHLAEEVGRIIRHHQLTVFPKRCVCACVRVCVVRVRFARVRGSTRGLSSHVCVEV
jgi:hypothetical protein